MPLTQVSSRLIEDTLRYVLGASGTNHYTFTGKGLTGAVNDPTLTLSRGHTYIFENRSGGHPFYIKTSIANGGTNDAYNTGVTNNGGGNGTEIVFTVPHDAPDLLYYQCSSHSSMNGQLKIAGAVADGSITESKLADDAVTADKLANSINTAIAANTAKDLTALSASNLTSGTVPDARFPATLPAASAANLTNVPAANITGTLPAISGANLTGISAGITVWDTWHFGSTISNYEGDLTDSAYGSDIGLVRPSALSNGIAWGSIGTGMTESGGIFTFPQTGMWEIVADYMISSSTAQQYSIGRIEVSADSGSSWQDFAEGGNAAPANGTYSFRFGGLMDVTNVSTTRIKLSLHVTANWTSGHSLDGSSTYKRSGVEFRRIGDT